MLKVAIIALMIDYALGTTSDCVDKGTSCTLNTCTKFPEFSRNNCAKTCGLCVKDSTSLSSRSRWSERVHESSHSTSERVVPSELCIDKDTDCSHTICVNFPHTAKERCAKFCGLCRTDAFTGLIDHSSSSLSSSTKDAHRSDRSCVDKDSNCKQDTCINYPYTAKERCAKTCGLCSSDSHHSKDLSSSGSHSSHHHSSQCVDESNDCTQETCRDLPYTAKHRCAKTCNLCERTVTGTHHDHSKIGGAPRSSSEINDEIRSHSSHHHSSQCVDESNDCTQEICRDLPYTAKFRCAKTCNLCERTVTGTHHDHSKTGGVSRSSSEIKEEISWTTRSPSRHSSITSHRSSSIHSNPPLSILTKGSDELECVDLDTNCKQRICENYPYTAKERCAKTCGLCKQSGKTRTQESSESRRGSTTSSKSLDTKRHESTACVDQERNCNDESCIHHPSIAKKKCAKTCGFCGGDSLISLQEPTIDDKDDSSIIRLDDDFIGEHGSQKRPSAASSHSSTGSRIGASEHSTSHTTQKHSHQSSSSSISSGHKGTVEHTSSSIRSRFTTKSPIGNRFDHSRRVGPCRDRNEHCEHSDCHKYPSFAKIYCEKTCNFC